MSSTAEQILRWADPEEGQFSGYACSAEEMHKAWLLARGNRQNFAYAAVLAELERRAGKQVPEYNFGYEYVDFSMIPARLVMDRNDFKRIANELCKTGGYRDSFSPAQLTALWNQMLRSFADFSGLGYPKNKYSPGWCDPKVSANQQAYSFESACRCSGWLNYGGRYKLRLLVNGSYYTSNCSIDIDPDVNYDGFLPFSGVEEYSLLACAIERRRREDKVSERVSFCDLATELTPNLFQAPYVPDEIYHHVDYFTVDRMYRACLKLGINVSKAQPTFRKVALNMISNPKVKGQVDSGYFPLQPTSSTLRPGVLFAHVQLLEDFLDNNSCSELEGRIIEYVLDETSLASRSAGLE